ncbi:uncharacterized protein METZ01_LOCUS438552, partial [marine metagenome]
TKGLLNEVLRHQKRLAAQKEEKNGEELAPPESKEEEKS